MKRLPKGTPTSERLEYYSMPVTETGCVIWTGCCDKDGYGSISINRKPQGAHRVAWELENGPIPEGMFILHRCDVRPCINENHLFLGTQADNMADMKTKGRKAIGENSGKAKLTENQVLEIISSSKTQMEIAAEYGVHQTTISLIKTRKNWPHLEACDA